MTWTSTQPSLPFQGRGSHARQASYDGARAAAVRREALIARYLDFLAEHGLVTDQGAAEGLGVGVSSICSTRNAAVERGLVESVGRAMGRHGVRVAVWRLRGGDCG